MKNILFASLFISLASSSQSQIVHGRPYWASFIRWVEEKEIFEKDTSINLVKTIDAKIILSYDRIDILNQESTRIYLNETPQKYEDSITVDLIWDDAKDASGRDCNVFLFYYKSLNLYLLRILYTDDDTGVEYHMKPFIIDIIPYKKTNNI